MSTYKLDITKDHCPMTFVKTKLKLSELQKNDILEIFLNEGEPLENVPKSAMEQGFKVIEMKKIEGKIHKVSIQK